VKAHRLLELARKAPAPGPNTMAGSEKEFFAQTSVRGKLQSVALGPFELRDIPTNLMLNAKGAYASESFSGTIGEGVLRRFNAIVDYTNSVMILEPNAELAKPFPARKTFGATFLSGGADYTQFTVTGIRKDSPAEAAGLKKDDVILAIDATPAAQLRLADVRKLLTEDGAHRALKIRRGEQTITRDANVSLVTLDEN
jgi:predicted metalloprotease with PDZ domain